MGFFIVCSEISVLGFFFFLFTKFHLDFWLEGGEDFERVVEL